MVQNPNLDLDDIVEASLRPRRLPVTLPTIAPERHAEAFKRAMRRAERISRRGTFFTPARSARGPLA